METLGRFFPAFSYPRSLSFGLHNPLNLGAHKGDDRAHHPVEDSNNLGSIPLLDESMALRPS